LWLADARVDHWIDPGRQSIAYLWRYYTGDSFRRSQVRMMQQSDTPAASLLGMRWQLVRRYFAYLHGRMAGKPRIWIKALKDSAALCGALDARRELQTLHRQTRGPGA
jgi:hypothetical protein